MDTAKVDNDVDIEVAGPIAVIRRGLATTPALRTGMVFSLVMALAVSVGKLVVPILVQQIIDRGIAGPGGYRPTFVLTASLIAGAIVIVIMILARAAQIRLLYNAQRGLRDLRVAAFAHIHRLSIAEHADTKRGALTARVTSDVEQLAMFVGWGVVIWVNSLALVVGTVVVMLWFSWQLTLLVLLIYTPVVPYARWVQKGQLQAYTNLRDRVSDMMNEISELVMGARVIRAYDYRQESRRAAHECAEDQYRSQMVAQKFFAIYLPVTDVVGGLALAMTLGVGMWMGPGWGMQAGELVAFLLLVSLFLNPISSITEVLDQTQTTMAAWRKVLAVLDVPIDVVEPDPGVSLPTGPLSISASNVHFRYRTGPPVLSDISVEVPAGTRVAIVGETGSGKTTFARLMARLADPSSGTIKLQDRLLDQVAGDERRRAVRMVPQDGFLFDATIGQNVAYGRDGAGQDEVRQSFRELGLADWLERMPAGLDTDVGERGENLSVGERQLVALARAHLADPGLLILDEATSAVDPETEQVLARALDAVSAGRTTVSIAHRLSTAEAAELVLVFDAGRLVEQGPHKDLVMAGGPYADLYESWIGNTHANR